MGNVKYNAVWGFMLFNYLFVSYNIFYFCTVYSLILIYMYSVRLKYVFSVAIACISSLMVCSVYF